MSLSIKKTLFAVGALALIVNAPVVLGAAAVGMVSLYMASYVICQNQTSCQMSGDLSDLMYTRGALLQNSTKVIPFRVAQATSILRGEALGLYQTGGNWPSATTFLSNGGATLYPQGGNGTKWCYNGDDEATCEGDAQDCPFTQTPSFRT